jgi:anti-anti-sigma regulatory factor
MLKPHMIGRNGQRGRPRRIEASDGSLGASLRVRRTEENGVLILQFSGTADLANLLTLRDASFTAIGDRPRLLCLDMRAVASVEIATINTLVTIGRVARMVGVRFALIPSTALRETLRETGLIRMLPPPDAMEEGDAAADAAAADAAQNKSAEQIAEV